MEHITMETEATEQTTVVKKFGLSARQHQALTLLRDNEVTEVYFGGAAGGGKTMLGCYWQITNRLRYPGTRGLIGRNELKNLLESTYISWKKVADMLGLIPGIDYVYNAQRNRTTFKNGSVIVWKQLMYKPSDKDFHSLGSTEYTDAFIDEVHEVTEKAFDTINSRLRWKVSEYGLTPKILCTGNPNHTWVRKKFIKDSNNQWVTLKPYQRRVLSKVSDNPDTDFVRVYTEQLEKLSEYDRKRLLEGDWDALPRTGHEYYHEFSNEEHRGITNYNPDEALHFMIDFNSNPYITLLVFHILDMKDYWLLAGLKEFCLPHPKNSTRAVTETVCEHFYGHKQAVFLYGDYTIYGQQKMGLEYRGEIFDYHYDVMKAIMMSYGFNVFDRVIPNKPVLKRKGFIKAILKKEVPIRLLVHPEMVETCNDFLYMKEGADAKKLKEKVRDANTNITYEKYGHPTDAVEYFVTSAFEADYHSYFQAIANSQNS